MRLAFPDVHDMHDDARLPGSGATQCSHGGARAGVTILLTPPPRRIVPDGVFDAFGWCESDTLEWRRPAPGPLGESSCTGPRARWDGETPIDGADPARMVFVMHRRDDGSSGGAFLPRELARVHAFGLGLTDEEALAPWAIDDATDELWARRVRPREVLWLAADNLNALFWGLHDWAHFHSHGPFEQRAWTELQCDATALAWLWINRDDVPLDGATWERVRRDATALSAARFASEGLTFVDSMLAAERVQALVGAPPRTRRS